MKTKDILVLVKYFLYTTLSILIFIRSFYLEKTSYVYFGSFVFLVWFLFFLQILVFLKTKISSWDFSYIFLPGSVYRKFRTIFFFINVFPIFIYVFISGNFNYAFRYNLFFTALFIIFFPLFFYYFRKGHYNYTNIFASLLLIYLSLFLFYKTSFGINFINTIGDFINSIVNLSHYSLKFLFGAKYTDHYFLLHVLGVLVFFVMIVKVLIKVGILKFVLERFQFLFSLFFDFKEGIIFSSFCNMFIGQSVSIYIVADKINNFNSREIFILCVQGFSTITSPLIYVYSEMGIDRFTLISSTFLSTCSVFFFCEIFYPLEFESDDFSDVINFYKRFFFPSKKSKEENNGRFCTTKSNSTNAPKLGRRKLPSRKGKETADVFVQVGNDDDSVVFNDVHHGLHLSTIKELSSELSASEDRTRRSLYKLHQRIDANESIERSLPIEEEEEKIQEKDVVTKVIIELEKYCKNGLKMAYGIAMNLFIFLNIISVAEYAGNHLLNYLNVSQDFTEVVGYLFYPISFTMSENINSTHLLSKVVFKKILFNEYIAFNFLSKNQDLLTYKENRAITAFTCGFSNISCIGIIWAVLDMLIKDKKKKYKVLSRLPFAIFISNIVCLHTSYLVTIVK